MRELFLLLFVVLSVPVVLKRPFWGVVLYLAFTVVRPEMLFWGSSRGSFVFKSYYILIFVGMFLRHDFTRLIQIMRREFLLMIWLFVAILLSIALAQYPVFRGYYYVFELLKGFGICAMLYLVVDDFEEFRTIQNVLIGCFAFMAVWGIDQQLRGNDRLEGLGGSNWGDSNGVAAMFVLFLPVALAKLFTSKKRLEFWTSLGTVCLMVALIVCTKSRAGLIGLATCLTAFGFYSRNMAKVSLVVGILILSALPFATNAYINRMGTMSTEASFVKSARDRITLWKTGLMVFSDNPVTGTGFLTFPEAKMKYEDRFTNLDDELRDFVFRTDNKKVTHNTYIQLMSDCGLLGAVPFILLVSGGIFLGFKARRMLRNSPENRVELLWICGISAGITGFAVCIMSIDAALVLEFYFQTILASILYRKLSAQHAEQESPAKCVGFGLMAEGKLP